MTLINNIAVTVTMDRVNLLYNIQKLSLLSPSAVKDG